MPHSHKLEEVGNCFETFSSVRYLSSVCENGQHAFAAVKQLSNTSNPMGVFCSLKDPPTKIFELHKKNQKVRKVSQNSEINGGVKDLAAGSQCVVGSSQ